MRVGVIAEVNEVFDEGRTQLLGGRREKEREEEREGGNGIKEVQANFTQARKRPIARNVVTKSIRVPINQRNYKYLI